LLGGSFWGEALSTTIKLKQNNKHFSRFFCLVVQADREREQAKKLRATYNLFLNNVREIIGNDEIPSEELHVAARVAYNICNTPTSNDHTKRFSHDS
jgi:hypothetical protein